MNQWEDDLLVAIKSVRNGYKVVELPPRQANTVTSSQVFDYEQAEAYIADQYPTATIVPIEDIEEETWRRQHNEYS